MSNFNIVSFFRLPHSIWILKTGSFLAFGCNQLFSHKKLFFMICEQFNTIFSSKLTNRALNEKLLNILPDFHLTMFGLKTETKKKNKKIDRRNLRWILSKYFLRIQLQHFINITIFIKKKKNLLLWALGYELAWKCQKKIMCENPYCLLGNWVLL